uniref:hypothetical protein n=1 Tax=Marinobacterium profundum TaxID=1714300 RepID=UPI000830F47A|nr:hypothetical protein [Marinobacterium profundum]
MFEAHFNTLSETAAPRWAEPARDCQAQRYADTPTDTLANTAPQIQQTPEQGLTRRIQSLHHACPLHVWAAPGKRKDASGLVHEHWFLYIEYCTRNGARIWQKLERAQADYNLDALFALALQAELPGIDSEGTRAWLKMHRGH